MKKCGRELGSHGTKRRNRTLKRQWILALFREVSKKRKNKMLGSCCSCIISSSLTQIASPFSSLNSKFPHSPSPSSLPYPDRFTEGGCT
ncbi:hypothetical protein RIF29_40320 [Crotalaria pallida]|uniref:Uncharacterized protein n=1 Tax=Crotalaria pallida TaxID=3830 RepID=A0AAN9HQJ2_CROPI